MSTKRSAPSLSPTPSPPATLPSPHPPAGRASLPRLRGRVSKLRTRVLPIRAARHPRGSEGYRCSRIAARANLSTQRGITPVVLAGLGMLTAIAFDDELSLQARKIDD